jgi:Domain of Unknown Function (DUF1543)
MNKIQLFMVLLGCKPPGRHTEQHDIFFGIAHSLQDLLPAMNEFWPEAAGNFHIDGWRAVTKVGNHAITIEEKVAGKENETRLFFLNLGGYKPGEFEEYHYKMLVAAINKGMAVQQAKQTAFYLHTGFAGASSHIDDKYGVDVDDVFEIADILPNTVKQQYQIVLHEMMESHPEDEVHLGYLTPAKLRKGMGSE